MVCSLLLLLRYVCSSSNALSLLKGLLTRDPAQRLGGGPDGAAAIKRHPFFRGLSWSALEARQLESKFKPGVKCSLVSACANHLALVLCRMLRPGVYVGVGGCRDSGWLVSHVKPGVKCSLVSVFGLRTWLGWVRLLCCNCFAHCCPWSAQGVVCLLRV